MYIMNFLALLLLYVVGATNVEQVCPALGRWRASGLNAPFIGEDITLYVFPLDPVTIRMDGRTRDGMIQCEVELEVPCTPNSEVLQVKYSRCMMQMHYSEVAATLARTLSRQMAWIRTEQGFIIVYNDIDSIGEFILVPKESVF
eukprot:Protomagalhaensia_wolfi_Nauph_80__4468@NODE_457_length_2485_cov_384_355683_g343_i0_p3_GENE_NODE_457_length_2485_cov_384_355683_g343_i0NODE_457_length_2485_cov_384_355683_g343_i0_p3_ORF_typecomplete_len144_score10_15_NODE_457_length_2485_cov_384_355683_g343_i06971128